MLDSSSTISDLNALLFKKPLTMLPKIMLRVSSEVFCTLKILKCLVNLWVNTDRPPPGGAATATITKLSTSLKKSPVLSYTPL